MIPIFIKELFLAPILSTITPIRSAPIISPIPRATIASVDNSNYWWTSLSLRVSTIMGNSNPVYTAMLIPVQAI